MRIYARIIWTIQTILVILAYVRIIESNTRKMQIVRVFKSTWVGIRLARPRACEYMRVFKYFEYFFDIRSCLVTLLLCLYICGCYIWAIKHFDWWVKREARFAKAKGKYLFIKIMKLNWKYFTLLWKIRFGNLKAPDFRTDCSRKSQISGFSVLPKPTEFVNLT